MSNLAIVKWAGGKNAMREKIVNHFPTKFNTYIEPFVGGGAIALNSNFEKVKINDLNQNLINMYQCLRDKVEYQKVLDFLWSWQNKFNNKDYLTEDFYYRIRSRYNFNTDIGDANKAALFIALNKLGFNGLYRENSKGEFNVPWGKRRTTKIYEKDKLEAIHKRLQNFSIYCGDYQDLIYFPNDFVYLDPPYDVVSGNFTSYNKTVFGMSEQARLAVFCDDLTYKGVKFCQSNADTPYIRELYRNYRIVEIEAPRRISCNGDRTKAKELLIMNYEK